MKRIVNWEHRTQAGVGLHLKRRHWNILSEPQWSLTLCGEQIFGSRVETSAFVEKKIWLMESEHVSLKQQNLCLQWGKFLSFNQCSLVMWFGNVKGSKLKLIGSSSGSLSLCQLNKQQNNLNSSKPFYALNEQLKVLDLGIVPRVHNTEK